MADFGKKPKKPGSVPGAASGGKEQRQGARVRGFVARVGRELKNGRASRNPRSSR